MPYTDRARRLQQSKDWYTAHKAVANARRSAHARRHPAKAIKREGPPQFCCIDGEGITREDVHYYTFLASSSGNSVANWLDGLHTSESFHFCLQSKVAHSVCCGFSLGYDFNMFFRDVASDILEILWTQNEVIFPLDGEWWKLVYIPSKFLNISLLTDVHTEHEKLKYKIKKSIMIWDVFGFFQGSFLKLLENGEWIPAHEMGQEVLDLIANMKADRKNFSAENREEIEHYCKEECRILQELMNRLAATLWETDIKLRSWHGAGAISGYLMKEHRVHQVIDWDGLPEIVREASLWAYFGGRVELFQQGPIAPPLYDYDRVSAYPSATIDLPDLTVGQWYGVSGGETNVFNPVCQHGIFKVRWDIPETHHYAWLAPFPQRGRDGAIYWVRRGEGWYHTSEVRQALRIFASEIQVERGVYYYDKSGRKPFSWVEKLLRTRLEFKKNHDPRHIVLKLGANSIYGKLAQSAGRDGRRPPFQNYFLAGAITARCRSDMLLAASHLEFMDCVGIATDGVFCTREIDELNISGDIGQWEFSQIDQPSFWAQAGVYYTPDGKHVRTRGFNPKSMDYETLMEAWANTPDESRPDISLPYTENRFTGLGYAASTGHWNEYRRWIDRERYLTLRTEPRKVHVDRDGCDSPYLLLPGEMSCERMPYAASVSNAEKLKMFPEEYLELMVLLDQPDYPS